METARIAELLAPYLAPPGTASSQSPTLTDEQLGNISKYIDILLRWNSRINLTAVREPEEIVRRHFGESLFAARHFFPDAEKQSPAEVIDVGSGAGFPGLPIKLWFRQAHVTLIEANNKKVAFLREVIRSITLINIDVFSGRAESFNGTPGDLVTLRAVEKFEAVLPLAVKLATPGGRMGILIGEAQYMKAKNLEPSLDWSDPIPVPSSTSRILAVATKNRSS